MPHIDENTPREELTIQGLTFQAPSPYKVGDTLNTEGEVSQLNQVFRENLRNNFSQTIYRKLGDYLKANGLDPDKTEDKDWPAASVLDLEKLEEEFDDYAAKYEFGVRQGRAGGPRTPSDPVGKEAYRIAMEKVKVAVQRKGIDWNSVPKEKRTELVKQVLDKYPDIRAEAERRVNATSDIALDEIDMAQPQTVE